MCQLFKVVKEKTGMNNNQIAKALGEKPELVSRWSLGKSNPNGINTLKLMQLADLDRDEAMNLMQKGNVSIGLLLVLCMTTILLVATPTIGLQATESKIETHSYHTDLYTLCE